ncbi:MAG: HAD family phosphatase [Firmicutes bacterium]|jgi:HAD superfamily hydrolase (TIGR01509 family)|nr:HAD family phosphatase [Bacillota bacterium]
MKNPQGIIFDLDGTLIDSLGIWVEVDYLYLRSKGKEPKPNLSAILKTMSMMQTIQFFKDDYGIEDSIEKMTEDVYTLAKKAYRDQIPLKEGALDLVEFFHKNQVKMSVATANHRPLADAAIERLGLKPYLSHVLICDEVGFGKEDPFIFEQAANLMETEISNTIVFEDSLHALQTAKRAGFYVVGVYDAMAEWEQKELREEAHLYLNSLREWPGLYD